METNAAHRENVDARAAGRRRAVLLILIVTAVALLVMRGPFAEKRQAIVGRDALRAAAEALARTAPERFRDFAPMSRWDCVSPDGAAIRRGRDFVLLRPSGIIFEDPPSFHWEAPSGSEAREIRLRRADGKPVWSKRPDRNPFRPADLPPLSPGVKYLWIVVGGTQSDTGRTFTVATEAVKRDYAAAAKAILEAAPPAAALLKAHYAIRHDLYGEAEKEVRAFLEVHPRNLVARETLYFLLARVGAGEAEALGIGH